MKFKLRFLNNHNIDAILTKNIFIFSSERCLKLERWQGPPRINTVTQYETVSPFKVSLFIQS